MQVTVRRGGINEGELRWSMLHGDDGKEESWLDRK